MCTFGGRSTFYDRAAAWPADRVRLRLEICIKVVGATNRLARQQLDQNVEWPPSTVHIVCNPVVAGWRCMAAGWLHACNSAKLRSEFSDRSNAPVNFTCRNWTTVVSSPCHFQLASILAFQSYYEISPIRRSILLVEVESLPISHNPYHSCIRHGR